jgi:phosphonate transport system permease protein
MADFISSLSLKFVPDLLHSYQQAVRKRRLYIVFFYAVLCLLLALSVVMAEMDAAKLFKNIGNFTSYFERLAHLESGALVINDPQEWFWGWKRWLKLMAETLMIAYVGTTTGGLLAFFLSFIASRNMTPHPWLGVATRRFLEFARTVPSIVFALIFVIAFGLGPVAGVMALSVHTMGALGKLFAEVIENVDMKPVEGIAASGGTWASQMRFAALPQVASNMVSYGLLRFEINVREASVMGFVGAGGIGVTLIEAIRKFYYSDVSAILVFIILTVMLIDYGTERLRHVLLGHEAQS